MTTAAFFLSADVVRFLSAGVVGFLSAGVVRVFFTRFLWIFVDRLQIQHSKCSFLCPLEPFFSIILNLV